jgi:para-nitrobenzyl esterase
MTRVETTYGTLEGIQRERHLAFFGIPYAAPPAGERRFAAPAPPAAWSGVRRASDIGFACPQSTHPIPGFAASGPQDEDCLNLNIFTPAADSRRRPVLFWIHGGGFTHGAGSEALYNGGPLAVRGDVVVVTINYRLGVFGYLYLDQHLPGAGLTANAGQLDQVAALEWVRDNIAAFGGDPGNVTIFGESAGAAAVGTLLTMPAAKGLFHRAVLQSGAGRANSPDDAARIADMVFEELGIARADAARIRTVPPAAIVEAQGAVAARARREGGVPFSPVRDGVTLPEQPLDAVRRGAAAEIPLLIGTNRDEVKLFAASIRREPIDDHALLAAVRQSLPKAGEQEAVALIQLYRGSRNHLGLPESNLDILDAIDSDARFRVPATRLALAQREHQPHTYAYLFTYASPARHGALGSCHALEMPFVFGTLDAPTQDRFAGTGPEVERLSANMMEAWLSFARTGSPGHEGIGPWAAYDADRRPTMVFDRASGLAEDPFGQERAAIERFV